MNRMAITNIPSDVLSGRSILRTDITTLNSETLKEDLKRVLPQHAYNRQQIRKLQEYLRGWHPEIQNRVKTTRTDVDNKITVNYAGSITRDIVGYFLGKPIQYTHRRGKFRVQMENFIHALKAENKPLVDYEIAEDCSICGVGYRGMFAEPTARNGTHLKILRLDPLDTFVVYSADPTKPPVYAVSAYETAGDSVGITGQQMNVSTRYKVYTPKAVYEYEDKTSNGMDTMAGANLEYLRMTPFYAGGGLPIVEYRNNMWRLGDWETAISIMDALDAVTSDGVNDIQQAVNSVLVAMGMELGLEEFENLSTNGFLNVANIPPGVNPVVEFISQAMDADVGVAMRDYLEATLRVIVGVPDRKNRAGGGADTGDAVFLRDGWQDIDLVASAKEPYFIQAERECLTVMMAILDTYKEIKSLEAGDIEIHFNRNKTANLQSKAQVFQTLMGSPDNPMLAPEDALDIAGLTNNVADVILRREAFVKEYAEMLQNRTDESTEDSNPGGGEASAVGEGD